MNSLRQEATLLRDKGYSYNMIKEELGISLSTMSYWFSDYPYIPNEDALKRTKNGPQKNGILRHNERVAQTALIIKDSIEEIGHLDSRDIWMLGLGLYIGEGSKSIESVRIVNSDPFVIKLAIRWFKEICKLNTDNLIISLNLYPDNDIEESIQYWHQITGLPLENFRKTQIDTRTGKKRSNQAKLKYGTVQIRVRANGDSQKGRVLFRKIRGWTQGALNQV